MSEMDDPDAGSAAGSLPVPASLVKVQSYLRRIVPVLMEEGNETPELATQELRSKTFQTFVSGFEKVEARIGSPCELGSGPRRRQVLHHKSLGLHGAPSEHR